MRYTYDIILSLSGSDPNKGSKSKPEVEQVKRRCAVSDVVEFFHEGQWLKSIVHS